MLKFKTNSLKLFLTRDMSEVSFLKHIFRECLPVRVSVFFEEAGTFHENNNLFPINISCWLCSTIIVAVIVQMQGYLWPINLYKHAVNTIVNNERMSDANAAITLLEK